MKKIIIIGGPTASFKSKLALEIADKFGGVIINADSMQVYFEIPILSAQPSSEDMACVPHKLYSFISGEIAYSVGKWLDQVVKEVKIAHDSNKIPIIVGGTGMYLNSIISGLSKIPDIEPDLKESVRSLYSRIGKDSFCEMLAKKDPEVVKKLIPNDKSRVIRAFEVIEQTGKSILFWQQMSNFSPFDKNEIITIISDLPRSVLYQYCDERFLTIIEDGAIDEVEYLNNNLQNQNLPISKALGVKELTQYLEGNISLTEAIKKAQTSTRQFAKRQVTWFKNQIQESEKITYSSINDFDRIHQYIARKISF